MSETKPTHTSGALRAAVILATEFKASPELRLRVLAAADIISRETGDLAMLEALEQMDALFDDEGRFCCEYSDQLSVALEKSYAAIRKAKGE